MNKIIMLLESIKNSNYIIEENAWGIKELILKDNNKEKCLLIEFNTEVNHNVRVILIFSKLFHYVAFAYSPCSFDEKSTASVACRFPFLQLSVNLAFHINISTFLRFLKALILTLLRFLNPSILTLLRFSECKDSFFLLNDQKNSLCFMFFYQNIRVCFI